MPRILAAIPAFNEEAGIGSVVLRTKPHVDEVLVIDDGSSDATAEVAKLAGATVYRHPRNAGKGEAIRSALRYAVSGGYDATVLLDGDGQHNPEDLPKLVAPVLAGQADLVCGLRWKGNTKMPLYRRVGKRILDYTTSVGARGIVTDSQCGYRALSKKAVETLKLEEKGFGVESEMLVEAKEKGLGIAEVPVSVRYDVGRPTKGPVAHGIGVVDSVLRMVAVRRPLFFFGVPGLGLFVVGILLGVHIMNVYNDTGGFAIGYALLVVVFLIIGSLSLFVGVILNVMPRVLAKDHGGSEQEGGGKVA